MPSRADSDFAARWGPRFDACEGMQLPFQKYAICAHIISGRTHGTGIYIYLPT